MSAPKGTAPGRTPPKSTAKVPAAIAKLPIEELQSMCVDTLKKLRARDKRIEELQASAASPSKLADNGSEPSTSHSTGPSSEVRNLQLQVEGLSAELAAAQQGLSAAAATAAAAAEQQVEVLRDTQESVGALEQQLVSLKDLVRTLSADRSSLEAQMAEREQVLRTAESEAAQLRESLVEVERQAATAAAIADAAAAAARSAAQAEAAEELKAVRIAHEAELTAAEVDLERVREESGEETRALSAAAAVVLSTALANAAEQSAALEAELEAAKAESSEAGMQMDQLRVQAQQAEAAAAAAQVSPQPTIAAEEAAACTAAQLAELQGALEGAKSLLAESHANLVSARGGESEAHAAAATASQQAADAAALLADLQSALESAKADLARAATESEEARLQSEAVYEALQQKLASALTNADSAVSTAEEQQESRLAADASRQAELESQVAGLESSQAELQAKYAAAEQALGQATAKACAASVSVGSGEEQAAEGDAAGAAAAAVAIEVAERESMELQRRLAAVEKQLGGLQDVVAKERKAHACTLGDQVMAVAAAESRADRATQRVAELESAVEGCTTAAADSATTAARDTRNQVAAAAAAEEADALRGELMAVQRRLSGVEAHAGRAAELEDQLATLRRAHEAELAEASTCAKALRAALEATQERVSEQEAAAAQASAEREAADNAISSRTASRVTEVEQLQRALAVAQEGQATAQAAAAEAAAERLALEVQLSSASAASAEEGDVKLAVAKGALHESLAEAASLHQRVQGLEEQLSRSSAAVDAATLSATEANVASQAAAAEVETHQRRLQGLELQLSKSITTAEAAASAAMVEAQVVSDAAAAAAAEQITNLESQVAVLLSDLESLRSLSNSRSSRQEPSNGHAAASGQPSCEGGAADLIPAGTEGHAGVVQERDALVKALADAKNKFVQMTKKRQQDHAAKVTELEAELQCLRARVIESQAAAEAAPGGSGDAEWAVAVAEKDRVLSDMVALKARHSAELLDLASQLEAKESGLASVTEQISSLQAAAQKAEQEWVRREAELRSEMAAAAAASDAARGALGKLRKDHEGERERVKKVISDMRRKMDRAVKERQKAEAAAAELLGRDDAELESLRGTAAAAEQRTAEALAAAMSVESELRDYKARAHVLLKAKEAEIKAARAAGLASEAHTAELQEARDARAEAEAASEAAQAALEAAEGRAGAELQDAAAAYEEQLAELQSAAAQHEAAADAAAHTAEQSQKRYEELGARLREVQAEHVQCGLNLEGLKQSHGAELGSVEAVAQAAADAAEAARSSALHMVEVKDAELRKLLEVVAALRGELQAALSKQEEQATPRSAHALASRSRLSSQLGFDDGADLADGDRAAESTWSQRPPDPFHSHVSRDPSSSALEGLLRGDGGGSSGGGGGGLPEAQLLQLAQRQADADLELAAAQRRALELEAEVADLTQECALRQEQDAALKEALRQVERQERRQATTSRQVDMEYLKNIILQLYQTQESAPLLTVLATMLHFSPAEVERCQEAGARAELQKGSGEGGPDEGGYLGTITGWFSGEAAPEQL